MKPRDRERERERERARDEFGSAGLNRLFEAIHSSPFFYEMGLGPEGPFSLSPHPPKSGNIGLGFDTLILFPKPQAEGKVQILKRPEPGSTQFFGIIF